MIYLECTHSSSSDVDAIRQARQLAEALNKTVSTMTGMHTQGYGITLKVGDVMLYIREHDNAEDLYNTYVLGKHV